MTVTLEAGTVLVATPAALVEQVVTLIAAHGSLASSEDYVDIPEQGRWTAEMVEALAEAMHYPLAEQLITECAARPGEWVDKKAVDNDDHDTAIQLRNELGAMSKAAKRLFGKKMWPLEWRRARQRYEYRMPEETARWWQQARNDSERAG